MTRN
jgi:hypothetical protein